jgi:hypothetical protein
MIEEIWKDIDFTNGEYQVSNLGRIKSMPKKVSTSDGRIWYINGKVLTNSIHTSKYLVVNIYQKKCLVHRLVAVAFLENTHFKSFVNHKDCDKYNNSLDNLEWVTHEENIQHAKENDRMVSRFGIDNPFAKAINQYSREGEFIKKWDSIADMRREFNVNKSNLYQHLKGSTRYGLVKGFKFQYA